MPKGGQGFVLSRGTSAYHYNYNLKNNFDKNNFDGR